MGTEKVIIHQTVIDKLNALVEILFDKDYFYIKENAKEYVYTIYTFMYDLPTKHHRLARNSKNGKYFCTYKPNKNTTWYITFDVEDDVYLVNNLTNNHSADYPRFIRGIK
jgi:chlorite dismutase